MDERKCPLTQLGGLYIENLPRGLTRRNSSSSPLYKVDKIFVRVAAESGPLRLLGNVAEIQNFPTSHQDLSMERLAMRGRRVHLHTLVDR